jgi:lipoprotein-releasing system permease protein
MTEWVQPALGFLSATIVALIALGFAAMFVFFSGSAALVLGKFLRFAAAPSVALPAAAAAIAVAFGVASALDLEPPWVLPAAQALWSGIFYGLICWRCAHRLLARAAGAVLLGCGVLFVAGLVLDPLYGVGQRAAQLAVIVVQVSALGSWPFVLAGLVAHARVRPVEWFLSLRYLMARRRQAFISIISVICVAGVALGVAVITVVLSVMNGFSRMWEEKIIGSQAHFAVHSRMGDYEEYRAVRERVLRVPGVLGATPFLAADAILRADDGRIQPVTLKGIDPETAGEATQLVDEIVAGSLDDLPPEPEAEDARRHPGLILGRELAERFFLSVGDPVILISPLGGAPTPLGPAPRMERFRVAGLFDAEFFQFDERLVYATLPAVQAFLRADDVASGVEVRTNDPYASIAVGQRVEAELGGLYYARDWKDFYPAFFQALKTERVMMFVLLSFIMVVAGFIITATLIMMIMEKSRDIAILKAMGCDDEGVLRVFAIGGVLIGVVGLAAGLATGLVITWNLERIQFVVERSLGLDLLPANVYQLQSLPYAIDPLQLVGISVIALVLSIGATLLPSWQAAKLDPAEALRYE